MKNKGFKRSIMAIFIIITILLSAIIVVDSVSAEDNAPKGYETYYMRGYGFNVPTSYKLVDEGWDEVNRLNYMNFQKGKNYVNISLERHSNSFNKNVMDGFSSFKLNDEKLYKTSISGITGFYNKRNKVKTFVFASVKGQRFQKWFLPSLRGITSHTIAMNMILMMMHIMKAMHMMTLLMIHSMMRPITIMVGKY